MGIAVPRKTRFRIGDAVPPAAAKFTVCRRWVSCCDSNCSDLHILAVLKRLKEIGKH